MLGVSTEIRHLDLPQRLRVKHFVLALLKEAGVQRGASWIVSEAQEEVKGTSSIPLGKAMDDCLVTWVRTASLLSSGTMCSSDIFHMGDAVGARVDALHHERLRRSLDHALIAFNFPPETKTDHEGSTSGVPHEKALSR
jgi:hypothetical protein